MDQASETVETTTNPDIGDVDNFERAALDAPEGRFRFTLESNYGMMQTQSGKPYINVRFILDQEAVYNEDGTLNEIVDLKRPHRLWHKFFVGTGYGDASLNSFLSETIGTPTGTLNPETKRYEYSKTAALNTAIGKSAWNAIRHKKNETYGWQIDINRDFEAKPRSRVRPTNTENGSGT